MSCSNEKIRRMLYAAGLNYYYRHRRRMKDYHSFHQELVGLDYGHSAYKQVERLTRRVYCKWL